jgi:hypothetical protein
LEFYWALLLLDWIENERMILYEISNTKSAPFVAPFAAGGWPFPECM